METATVMSSMVRIKTMPDELSLGYLGRVTFIKCLDKAAAKPKNPRFIQVATGIKRSEQTPLAQMSQMAGLSEAEFAQRHSMLPVVRVAVRVGIDQVYGDPTQKEINRKFGLTLPKQGVFVCAQCAKEDTESTGFSWFRRQHHLQGVDWCSTHQIGLLKVDSTSPWLTVPSMWIEAGKTDALKTESNFDDSFLVRLAEISCHLLNRARPFRVDDLAMILSVRAKTAGWGGVKAENSSWLSDLVRTQAPAWWLKQYLSCASTGSTTDGALALGTLEDSWSIPRSGFFYAVLLAALFDSGARAIAILEDLDQGRYGEAVSGCLCGAPHQMAVFPK